MSVSTLPAVARMAGLDELIMRMFRSSLGRPGMMSFGALEVGRARVRH
jgi:hypothetical protein